MVQVKEYTQGSLQTREVDATVLGERILGRTLKDAVVMYEANARAGTHKAKSRGEVAGPNRKLWKQKHTGRARMGTKKSPLWRGGGIVFPPLPRDYEYHLPIKARRAALRNALYSKLRDGEAAVADGWPQGEPSTKQAVGILRALGVEKSVLVVTDQHDSNLHLSLRNVPGVDVRPLGDLNAHQVLVRRHIVFTPAAFDALLASRGYPGEAQARAAAGAES
jgi:large subunit ribosomal protein L4